MIESKKNAPSAYQRRLLGVHAPLSVTLAERKDTLGSLLSLTPGAILPLHTRCDQPLRLSIGGQSIGTVDAVRIGDKLGVQVREMGGLKTGEPHLP